MELKVLKVMAIVLIAIVITSCGNKEVNKMNEEDKDCLGSCLAYYPYRNSVIEADKYLKGKLSLDSEQYLQELRRTSKSVRDYIQGNNKDSLVIQDVTSLETKDTVTLRVDYIEDQMFHSKRTTIIKFNKGDLIEEIKIWDLSDNPYNSDRLWYFGN